MDSPEEQRRERTEWSTEGCDFKITLPFPPSVNTLYPIVRGRKILSKKGREYKEELKNILAGVDYKMMTGKMDVRISLVVPDNRRRDVDNYNKALLDCLTEQGVFKDDSQIIHLTTRKSGPLKVNGKNLKGAAEVAIWEYPSEDIE